MSRMVKLEYRLGDIAPNTTGVVIERHLTPQPCLLREVHTQGMPSTNYSVKIFTNERKWPVDKVYEKLNVNGESHDFLLPERLIYEPEKTRVWFMIDNNDTLNSCRLVIVLVVRKEDE